jgi:hypothetical protein
MALIGRSQLNKFTLILPLALELPDKLGEVSKKI